MGPDDRLGQILEHTPSSIPAFGHDLEQVVARATSKRRRAKIVSSAIVMVLVVGLAVPLTLLAGLRASRETGSATPRPSTVHSSSQSGSGPPPGWVRHADSQGDTIDAPADWTFNPNPTPALVSPPMLFAIGTGQVPSGGDCAPSPAIEALPADGALFTVQEYAYPDEPYTFDLRPAQFDLGRLEGPFECFGVKAHMIEFQDGGRYFQVFAMFGPQAPASLQREVAQSLDSIFVVPAPANQRPNILCRAGDWTSCPQAAWVYQVVLRAGVIHLGHRGTGAILGLAHHRSFALWTTPFSLVRGPAAGCEPVSSRAVCRIGNHRLAERFGDVWLWIGAAPSPSPSIHSRATLPDHATLTRIFRTAAGLPLPS
jgi:hypothetical protein